VYTRRLFHSLFGHKSAMKSQRAVNRCRHFLNRVNEMQNYTKKSARCLWQNLSLINVVFGSLLAAVIILLWSVSGRHLSVKFHGRQTVSEVYSRTEDSNPEKRFRDRRERVSQVCDAEGIRGLDKFMVEHASRRRPNILYIDEYKLLYCVIPKVGCTNWKKVLLYLSGKLKQSVAEEIEAGHWWKIPGSFANDPVNLEHMNFWSLNRTERLKRLKTHTKFMVTREPFERILSAYRNKLEHYRQDTFGEIAYKIHKIFGHKDVKEGATFGEFLNHLVDHNANTIPKNEHWETYWSLCYPCDIDYDYILKLDTIEEDSEWLLDHFNIDRVKYPRGTGSPSNSSLLLERLKSVPGALPNAVYKHLQLDYKLFGYPKPDFIHD